MGSAPHLLPVSVAISGAGQATRQFRFGSIEDRAFAPQLVGLATLHDVRQLLIQEITEVCQTLTE